MLKKFVKRVGGVFGINEVRDDIGALRDIEHKHADQCRQEYNKLMDGFVDLRNECSLLLTQFRDLETQLTNARTQLEKNGAELDDLKSRLESTEESLGYSQKLATLHYESLATLTAGSTGDSQKRFFNSIAPARGDLRIFQLGCEKLMFELFEICKKHNLPIWIHSGTLLGAVRNQGFIPWDDDTDTSMMREDIKSLRKVLKNHPKYRLTLCFDYNVYCRQLRFRTRDPKNPCFVDIFISDYTEETDKDQAFSDWISKKHAIIRRFEAIDSAAIKAWRRKKIIAEDEEFGAEIAALFNQFFPEPSPPTEPQNCHIDWGLDNLKVMEKRLVSYDTIFPTTPLKFEGHSYAAPQKYHEFLIGLYDDYFDLPKNVFNHFRHVHRKDYNIPVVKKFLSE